MKRNIAGILIGFIFVTILAGCGEPKVNDGPPKKAIDTYLAGFRDKNVENIYSTVSSEAYQELRLPGKLEGLFRAQDLKIGEIIGWTYQGKPYVDEVNNQALIQTLIKTTKTTMVFEFDVRKLGDRWYIYGIKQQKSIKETNSK